MPALPSRGRAALRPFLAAALADPAVPTAPCSPSPPPTGRPRIWAPPRPTCSGRDVVAVLPSWETLPHERLSPRPDTVGRRLSIFRRLADPATAPRVVVAAARSLIQPIAPGLGRLDPVDAAGR